MLSPFSLSTAVELPPDRLDRLRVTATATRTADLPGRTSPPTARSISGSGYPIGWRSVSGIPARMCPVWHSSRVTVAMTESPAESNYLSLPFCILYASQDRGIHEGRE